MRTFPLILSLLFLGFALSACSSDPTKQESVLQQFCTEFKDVGQVSRCELNSTVYIKMEHNNLGGGITWQTANGILLKKINCPIVGPDSMSAECKMFLENPPECTKTIQCQTPGDEPTPPANNSDGFIACPTEKPDGPVACTREYMPVCGRTELNVGDTVFSTFGNECEACAAMKVVGYTDGACADVTAGRSYKSTNPDDCARIKFACQAGQQYFGDDTGCGCEWEKEVLTPPPCAATTCEVGNTCIEGRGCVPYTECKDPRPEMCTMQYDPVCADKDNGIRCIKAPCPSTDKVTYGNGCSACSDKAVYGFVPGECPTTGKKPALGAIWCEKMDPEGPCTMDYTPVCGNDGKTYGNACGACRAQNQYYVPGECSA